MQEPVAVVSLPAVLRNARVLRRIAGVPLIAVVKDDAYGHGAQEVACALEDLVLMFAVATVDEGAKLKIAGTSKDVLVLTPPSEREEAVRAAAYDLILTAASFPSLGLCAGCRAHFALNTGMNRYGFHPQEVLRACKAAKRQMVRVEGVFSHFYDAADAVSRTAQIRTFGTLSALVRRFYPDALRHLSATGGILAGDGAFDAVRPGIGLYGYAPPSFSCSLTPAMKVYADVLACNAAFGGGAGYARAVEGCRSYHTLGVGYGDGFFRSGGLGSVGALCMDACVRKGEATLRSRVCVMDNAERYAAQNNTTAYEVLTAIGKGVNRRYER